VKPRKLKVSGLPNRAGRAGTPHGDQLWLIGHRFGGGRTEQPGLALLHDRHAGFPAAHGAEGAFVVRPDGYIGWRGRSWRETGMLTYVDRIFPPTASATQT
jgi:hypothetical protein